MNNFENQNQKCFKEKQENNINIGEVYFDKKLENVLNKKEFITEIQEINNEIEEYLGENKNPSVYDFRIYSERNGYENYLRTNFPEKPEENYMDNDMFSYYNKKNNRNIIGKFMKLDLDSNDLNVQKYLEKEKITFDELQNQVNQNYKNNIYPTIAHELTHSHSFFKGIHYRDAGNKWAQEMVCVFIDQKMWEKYVPNYKEMIKAKAKEQAQNKNLYDEIIKDFNEGDFQVEDWERLFYQFLEKQYGKEKLKEFWDVLSESEYKDDFEKCFDAVFEKKLKDDMNLFQKEIISEK